MRNASVGLRRAMHGFSEDEFRPGRKYGRNCYNLATNCYKMIQMKNSVAKAMLLRECLVEARRRTGDGCRGSARWLTPEATPGVGPGGSDPGICLWGRVDPIQP